MDGEPELTVLTLTWNEAGSLDRFFSMLLPAVKADVGEGFELLVVDGGSSDGTAERARRAGARVVTQSLPGYGNAYREGLSMARGKWILTLDADSSHPMELFREMWRRREGRAVVMGSRYLPGGADARPPGRRVLSVILNAVFRRFLGLPLRDISGGFRLYDAAAAKAARSRAPFYDVVAEIIVLIHFAGGPILELPYRYVPRQYGASKARIIRFGLAYLRTLLRLWWIQRSRGS